MMKREQQHVGGAMGAQVVDNRIDLIGLCRQPSLDPFEEVSPIGARAPAIGMCQGIASCRSEGAEDVAFAAPSVVEFLFRPTCSLVRSISRITRFRSHHFLTRVAFGTLRSHFIKQITMLPSGGAV